MKGHVARYRRLVSQIPRTTWRILVLNCLDGYELNQSRWGRNGRDRWCVDRGRIIERGGTLCGSMAKYIPDISWKWPGGRGTTGSAVVINETKLSNCFCLFCLLPPLRSPPFFFSTWIDRQVLNLWNFSYHLFESFIGSKIDESWFCNIVRTRFSWDIMNIIGKSWDVQDISCLILEVNYLLIFLNKCIFHLHC